MPQGRAVRKIPERAPPAQLGPGNRRSSLVLVEPELKIAYYAPRWVVKPGEIGASRSRSLTSAIPAENYRLDGDPVEVVLVGLLEAEHCLDAGSGHLSEVVPAALLVVIHELMLVGYHGHRASVWATLTAPRTGAEEFGRNRR